MKRRWTVPTQPVGKSVLLRFARNSYLPTVGASCCRAMLGSGAALTQTIEKSSQVCCGCTNGTIFLCVGQTSALIMFGFQTGSLIKGVVYNVSQDQLFLSLPPPIMVLFDGNQRPMKQRFWIIRSLLSHCIFRSEMAIRNRHLAMDGIALCCYLPWLVCILVRRKSLDRHFPRSRFTRRSDQTHA